MPNVAFWTYTRKLAGFQPPTRFTNGALATAKQQGPEGRTGPAGNSPQCLTLLSEPTRKLAVAVSSRQQGSQTAPSPQRNSRAMRDGPGLRATAPSAWPAGNSRHCLTLLSEPSRKLAVFQLPTRLTNGALATANQQRPEGRTEPCGSCLPAATKEAHKRRPRHSETAGPWSTDRACGQWPPVPNVAFWTYKKTSCLPAAKEAHKRRPRHSETAGPWSTDRACGQRPPVPNVAFRTYKKTSCLPAAKEAHKRRPRHSETAGPWGTDRACGQWPPVPNVAFWTYKKTSCLPAANKAHKRRPRHSETAGCLPAANKAHKRRARHSETAGPWWTDRACGQRPPSA